MDRLSLGLFCFAFVLVVVVSLASGKSFLFSSFVDREEEPVSYWIAIVKWVCIAAAMGIVLAS